jgi:hypothetical protein
MKFRATSAIAAAIQICLPALGATPFCAAGKGQRYRENPIFALNARSQELERFGTADRLINPGPPPGMRQASRPSFA